MGRTPAGNGVAIIWPAGGPGHIRGPPKLPEFAKERIVAHAGG